MLSVDIYNVHCLLQTSAFKTYFHPKNWSWYLVFKNSQSLRKTIRLNLWSEQSKKNSGASGFHAKCSTFRGGKFKVKVFAEWKQIKPSEYSIQWKTRNEISSLELMTLLNDLLMSLIQVLESHVLFFMLMKLIIGI